MRLEATPLAGLVVIHPRVFEDPRGFFFECYNEDKFRDLGIDVHWAQDNHACSIRDTLRGLHFQLGVGQAKLVRCIRGTVWDVAVDIRVDSPTLGQWFGLELSAENRAMMFVPAGFAHGYCVLSDTAEVVYKCSTVYDAKLESEIAWNDAELGVAWPVARPLISERDRGARSYAEYLASMRPAGS